MSGTYLHGRPSTRTATAWISAMPSLSALPECGQACLQGSCWRQDQHSHLSNLGVNLFWDLPLQEHHASVLHDLQAEASMLVAGH